MSKNQSLIATKHIKYSINLSLLFQDHHLPTCKALIKKNAFKYSNSLPAMFQDHRLPVKPLTNVQ